MTFRAFEAARVLTGNLVGVLFWFTAWLLNAYFTIVSVTDFGSGLASVSFDPIAMIGGLLANSLVVFILHTICSIIEGNVWMNGGNVWLWATFLPILFLDIGSTYYGLLIVHAELGATFDPQPLIFLALAGALLPEKIIVQHLKAGGILR